MTPTIETLAGLVLSGVLFVGFATGTPSVIEAGCSCTVPDAAVAAGEVGVGDRAVQVSVQSGSSASHVEVETDVTAGDATVDAASGSVGIVVDGVEANSSQHVVRAGGAHDTHVVGQASSVEVVQNGEGQASHASVVQQRVSQSVADGGDDATSVRSTRSDGCLAWRLWRLGLGAAGRFVCP